MLSSTQTDSDGHDKSDGERAWRLAERLTFDEDDIPRSECPNNQDHVLLDVSDR
jgi:hypothetical protein